MNNYKKLKIYKFASKIDLFKKSKEIKCLIFGNFGAMNLGDESILSGQINEILENRSDADICVVSRYPNRINKIHPVKNIRAVYLKDPLKIFVEIVRSNIVIIGGGGLFCKTGDNLNGLLYQQYFMWLFMFLSKILNKKVYALGIGIYENMNKINLFTAITMLRNIDKVTVRDFHSYKLLRQNKVKVNIYKDNSYLMPISHNQILDKISGKNKRIKIGMSLRRPNSDTSANKLLEQLVLFMKDHKKYEYCLFSLDSHPNKKNDILFNRNLINLAKRNSIKLYKSKRYDKPHDAFLDFKKMDYMICMRLHSMIFSDRLSVPFCGISYDIKCESFLQSIGKKSLDIDNKLSNVLRKEIKL
jgi:polysaccharide pyruvyl transferase WcaK-like protein